MIIKILKYCTVLLTVMSFAAVTLAQQDVPSVSEGELQFYLDEASFVEDEKVYQEFYLMIFAEELQSKVSEGEKYAVIEIDTQLRNSDGSIISEKDWQTEALIQIDSTNNSGLVVYDQWAQILDKGNYEIRVSVSDHLGRISGKLNKKFEAASGESEFAISEIQFASSIDKNPSSQNHFKKGNLTINPNPSRRYGLLNPVVYFYYEIYKDSPSQNQVTIKYDIRNQDGGIINHLSKIRD